MTQSDLAQLRSVLESKLASLETTWHRDGIEVERSADPSEEAQFAFDRDLIVRTLEQKSALLAAIRTALQRMDSGDYGVCDGCEREIGPKRLAAMPWASYCIVCQEHRDRAPARNGELLAACD